MKRFMCIVLTVAAGISFVSCAATDYQRYNTQGGAVIGGALGAIAGQAIGRNTAGTLIGAGSGVLLGALIGNAMDQNQANGGRPYYSSRSRAYDSYDGSGGSGFGTVSPDQSDTPPGEWVTVPGQWINGRWVPSHRKWVPVNP